MKCCSIHIKPDRRTTKMGEKESTDPTEARQEQLPEHYSYEVEQTIGRPYTGESKLTQNPKAVPQSIKQSYGNATSAESSKK